MTLLEDDVADLQDEVEEVETSNTLQDERLNTVEEAVIQNVNEIDGETHYYFSKRIIEELLGNIKRSIKQIFMKTETNLLHFSYVFVKVRAVVENCHCINAIIGTCALQFKNKLLLGLPGIEKRETYILG